jgi:hypothetical protein
LSVFSFPFFIAANICEGILKINLSVRFIVAPIRLRT